MPFKKTNEDQKMSLSLVVPVFNEAENVGLFVDKVIDVFSVETTVDIQFVFVNDGSDDNTLDALVALQQTGLNLKIVDLSRNFGKEAALTEGLDFAEGDVVVPIDVDLQDPPELILQMIDKWRDG